MKLQTKPPIMELDELKNHILAINKDLEPVINSLSPEALLRNCHPMFREAYALQLYRAKVIDRSIAIKFVKIGQNS